MRRKLFLTCLLLAMLPTLVVAQTGKLRGRVTDKETGDALIGVNVIVEGTQLGAATDASGTYVVIGIPPGVYTVRASYIGYQELSISNIRISPAVTATQDFELQSSAIEVEALAITAERPLVQRNTTNTVRLTTTEDIENLPIRGLQNIVSLNPGIVQQDGELYIRGGRSREVAYFIDGATATNPLSNSQNISVIQEAIEEIQLQAGGYTAEFGGANSGIVNTTLKTGGPQFKATLDYRTDDFAKPGEEFLGTTSQGYRNVVATAGGPLGSKFRFFVAGQHNYYRNRSADFITPFRFDSAPYIIDDGLTGRTPGDTLPGFIEFKQNYLPNNQQYDNQAQGTLLYTMSSALRFRITGTYQHTKLPLGRSNFRDALNNIFRATQQENDSRTYSLGLKATHLLNPTTFYEVNVNYSDNAAETVDPVFGDDWRSYADRRAWAAAGRDTSDWVGVFRGPRAYSSILNFTFAAPNAPINGYGKSSQTSLGASVDFSTQVNKNIELKAGGRFDRWTIRNYGVGNIANYLTLLNGIDGNTPREFTGTDRFSAEYIRRVEVSKAGAITNYGWDYEGNSKINEDSPNGPRTPFFGSGYVQSKLEYRDLILNVGLRYERIDIQEWRPENAEDPDRDSANEWLVEDTMVKTDPKDYLLPRVNFAFPVTDNTVFYAQYGKYVQMPRLSQIYLGTRVQSARTLPETRSLYALGNFGVTFFAEPEKTNQYELGIRQLLTDNFAFTITAFYKDLLDQLRSSPILADGESSNLATGTRYVSGWTNEDFGTTKGLELTLELRRTQRLAARLNYTLSDSRGTGSDSRSSRVAVSDATVARYPTLVYPLDFNQTHRGVMMVDYRYGKNDAGFLEGFGFNALLNFNSGHNFTQVKEPFNLGQANPWNVGVRATQDVRGRNPIEPVNSSTTPWNFTLDLNIDKMFYFNKFNLKLYAIMLNALNTRNVINVYETTGTDDDDGWLKSPLARQYVAQPGYEDFYRAINLDNRWGYLTATGLDLWGSPRQIRFGVAFEFF